MQYYVGWDVGGWNCDKNRNSRDALAVLGLKNNTVALYGNVFRGNAREEINRQQTLGPIVNSLCKTKIDADDSITVAIDTPLGLPRALHALMTGGDLPVSVPPSYAENPYLYRQTEFWLFRKGFSPLSAVKDMIGSQATKGMHLISKLGLKNSNQQCGVWSAGEVTAVETYPTPAMTSMRIRDLYAELRLAPLSHDDQIHAVFCALIAYLYATDKAGLVAPEGEPPLSEGWIWIPADAIAT